MKRIQRASHVSTSTQYSKCTLCCSSLPRTEGPRQQLAQYEDPLTGIRAKLRPQSQATYVRVICQVPASLRRQGRAYNYSQKRSVSFFVFFVFFSPIPCITSAHLAPSCSLPVVTQIRGHIVRPCPPYPVIDMHCSRLFIAFSSLVYSRRIVPNTHATHAVIIGALLIDSSHLMNNAWYGELNPRQQRYNNTS